MEADAARKKQCRKRSRSPSPRPGSASPKRPSIDVTPDPEPQVNADLLHQTIDNQRQQILQLTAEGIQLLNFKIDLIVQCYT